MNEREKTDYCTLWQEARDLAMERGLEMSLICPMDEVCTGKKCFYIDPKKKVHDIIYKDEVIIGC